MASLDFIAQWPVYIYKKLVAFRKVKRKAMFENYGLKTVFGVSDEIPRFPCSSFAC